MFKYLILLMLTTVTLSAELKILAFAGSTRQDSCNKKLVREAAFFAEQLGASVTLIDLKDYPMPLY
jgi:NAD(P)H-dependent FMN reductase